MEFYFSDSNLLTDAFLFKLVEGPANNSVPLTTLHSFKRMRRFQPFSAVVTALKDSETLNLIEVDPASKPDPSPETSNDTDTKDTTNSTTNPSASIYTPSDHKYHVQRKNALPPSTANKTLPEVARVHEDASMARSVYAKGFGSEQPTTQFDIEAFFALHGTTRSVRLRRSFNKIFKGSVFVEFDDEETAKKFLDNAKTGEVKYQGKDLKIMSKKAYCDEKVEEIRKGNIRKHSPQREDKKGGDSRDWRTRRDEDRKNGFRGGRGGRGGGRGRGRDDRGGGGGGGGAGGAGGDREEPKDRDNTAPPTIKSTNEETDANNKNENPKPPPSGNVEEAAAVPAVLGSKKRAREEDNDVGGGVESEQQQASKRIDNKDAGNES